MSKIIEVNSVQQYKDDMAQYGIYVNRKRMVPSIRDGLKTIHRRIVYTAFADEKAITRRVKSAAIVGTTMKKYHPHGSSAIEEAMKPISNWFEIYMPLLDGKGNWGSFQGDQQAASRYTETKISSFAEECVIGELANSKQIVDWVDNYDGTTQEPEFLPVSVPLLLINGTFGIGIGLRAEVPKHNINEVIDATLNLIKNPNADVVLIPDQCMKCEIIDSNFKAISNKGNGTFRVRGIIDIETIDNKVCLVIKSTADLIFLNSITDKIEKMIVDKKLIQIVDAYDDSSKSDMRYVLVLKKGTDPNFVREAIYKNTDMEKTFKVNFEALDGIEPVRMSYKSYLQYFIEFRKMTKFRLYCNKLQDVQTKLHERDAYIKVLQSGEIDNIIRMIRSQSNIDDNYLVEYLVSKLNITDLQASFILRSDIRKLSMGYLNKYIQDAIELEQIKTDYLNKITDDSLLLNEIVEELKYYKKKYGKPRNCKVIANSELTDIPQGEFKIIITEKNFIKKVPLNDSIGSFRGDSPKMILKGENTECIILFDELGKVFKLPIHKIPFSDRSSNGIDIRTLIKHLTSNINKVMYEPTLKDLTTKTRKYFITVLSKNGYIKKLDIEDFLTVPPSGIIYTKLEQGDIVKGIDIVASDLDIIVYSKNKALRMNLSEVPHQKRNTKGLISMAQDTIDGLNIIQPNNTDIVVITEDGKINRFDVVALPNMGRNKAGSKVIKLSKTDSIFAIYGVNVNDIIKITTKEGINEFRVSDITSGTSISTGNKMLSTKTNNIIRCDIIRNV